MNDLALDPSETRARAVAPPRRPVGRFVLFGVLGLAGTGAFAGVASTVLSGFAGPQRAPVAIRQKASDWPDLKDGLPVLSTAGSSVAENARATALPDPAKARAIQVREASVPAIPVEPIIVRQAMPEPVKPPVVASTVRIPEKADASPAAQVVRPERPLPGIVNVPVIEPARQATLVPPARSVAAVAPLQTETVRARTGAGTFAALPPEPAKSDPVKPVGAKSVAAKPAVAAIEPSKMEPAKAKARSDVALKPVGAEKPVAEKLPARKPASVVANAAAAEVSTADEDTEVFGIKVPSFAPAGRKIRESVEALGDAVKGLPDRF